MEIRLVAGQYKSSSARERIPKLAIPIFGSRNLTHIQSVFGEETTRGAWQGAWDQFITGTL